LDNIGEKRYLAMERPALKVEGDTVALEVIGQITEVAGES
jgi:hypothetical protein